MDSITDKLDERIDIQAGPSDQRPVDVRLGHQLGDILRRDAAPVEDGQLRRRFPVRTGGRSIPG